MKIMRQTVIIQIAAITLVKNFLLTLLYSQLFILLHCFRGIILISYKSAYTKLSFKFYICKPFYYRFTCLFKKHYTVHKIEKNMIYDFGSKRCFVVAD
jgi:hypothetical protein